MNIFRNTVTATEYTATGQRP